MAHGQAGGEHFDAEVFVAEVLIDDATAFEQEFLLFAVVLAGLLLAE